MVVYDWKPQKGFCMFALAILFDHIIKLQISILAKLENKTH